MSCSVSLNWLSALGSSLLCRLLILMQKSWFGILKESISNAVNRFSFFFSTLCNINSHWIIDKAFASYLNHSTYFVKVLTLNFFFRINISDAWIEGNPFCIGVNNLYQELQIRDCNERLPFLCYKEADILSFKPSRHLQIECHKQCHLDFQKIKINIK